MDRTVKVNFNDAFAIIEESQESGSIDLDDPQQQYEAKKQINKRLQQLVNIKIQLMVNQAVKTLLEELLILLVWFSAVYKQNILSLFLIVVIIVHTYTKGRTGNWVKYTVTFVILF